MDRQDITVFIVDDDTSVHKSLKRLINSAGYRAKTFGSAREFINSGQYRKPGILILDVRMPAMSGLELQTFLVDSGSQMPIVFISAHDDGNARQQAMDAGAMAFLTKPFSGQVLLDFIEKATGRELFPAT